MYKGHERACSVVLEAVVDRDMWIWHAFFGMTQGDRMNFSGAVIIFIKLSEHILWQLHHQLCANTQAWGGCTTVSFSFSFRFCKVIYFVLFLVFLVLFKTQNP
jgi:hypothetical protein